MLFESWKNSPEFKCHLETWPFKICPTSKHSKSGLVRFSDPNSLLTWHSILGWNSPSSNVTVFSSCRLDTYLRLGLLNLHDGLCYPWFLGTKIVDLLIARRDFSHNLIVSSVKWDSEKVTYIEAISSGIIDLVLIPNTITRLYIAVRAGFKQV